MSVSKGSLHIRPSTGRWISVNLRRDTRSENLLGDVEVSEAMLVQNNELVPVAQVELDDLR